MVKISQPGNVLSLEIPAQAASNFNPITLPQLLTGDVQRGDVVVKNLNAGTATIAATRHLDLTNSKINTSGDLTLRGQERVTIKDNRDRSVNIRAGNRLWLFRDKYDKIIYLA
jgi:hypothetical protein